MITRRKLLQQLTATGALGPLASGWSWGSSLPPVRAITRPPGHHWFGYYGKHQFDPTDRFVLGMPTPFEGRTPRTEDELALGMVDLEDGDSWLDLGQTTAWGWQQGCMLQWRPGGTKVVIDSPHGGDGRQLWLIDVSEIVS